MRMRFEEVDEGVHPDGYGKDYDGYYRQNDLEGCQGTYGMHFVALEGDIVFPLLAKVVLFLIIYREVLPEILIKFFSKEFPLLFVEIEAKSMIFL